MADAQKKQQSRYARLQKLQEAQQTPAIVPSAPIPSPLPQAGAPIQGQMMYPQPVVPSHTVSTPQPPPAVATTPQPQPLYPQPPAPTAAAPLLPAPGKQQAAQTRLDPQKLPNPTRGFGPADVNDSPPEIQTYQSQGAEVPPRPDSDFIIQDTYNASPRFLRSSIYCLPTTSDLHKSTGVPLTLIASPFAEVGPGEHPVPVLDMSALPGGPIRCNRCRAFINPFVTFISSGDKYICPFCNLTNDVPASYFSPLLGNQRQDFAERVELWRGSIDFVATADYKTARTVLQPTTYLFVVDTSLRAIQSGMLESFVLAMQRLLPLFEASNSKIGIMTFDNQICFYNVDPKLKQPQMMVVGDVQAPFLPLPLNQFLVPYSKSKSNIDQLLTKLPSMFANTQVGFVCTGAALKVACKALSTTPEGLGGGKILLFTGTQPTVGSGALRKRDHLANPETEKENLLYQPQTEFYTKLSQLAAKHAISVDLFLGPAAYLDVNSLGPLSTATGGQVYYYPMFTQQIHQEQLYRELYRNLTRNHGTDTVLRMRCSQGLTVKTQYGHYSHLNETDLAIPHFSADSTLAFEFGYDDTLTEERGGLFQLAALHTDPLGQRRIRVHTLRLPATSAIAKVFKSVDLDSVLSVLARKSAMEIPLYPMSKVRKTYVQKMVAMLSSYRKHCAKTQRDGQLILPDALKLLPIYSLGLLKSPLMSPFRPGTLFHTLPDTRSYMVSLLHTTPLRDLSPWLYPLVFEVHKMGDHPFHGVVNQENGFVPFPGQHRLTRAELTSDGIFLMDTLSHLYLWVGQNVDPGLLAQVLPQDYINADPSVLLILPRIETELSARIFNLLSSRRLQRTMSPEIYVVKQASALEHRVLTHLLEDSQVPSPRDVKDMSYIDFLCHVHRRIQSSL